MNIQIGNSHDLGLIISALRFYTAKAEFAPQHNREQAKAVYNDLERQRAEYELSGRKQRNPYDDIALLRGQAIELQDRLHIECNKSMAKVRMIRALAQIVYTQNGNRHADVTKLLDEAKVLIEDPRDPEPYPLFLDEMRESGEVFLRGMPLNMRKAPIIAAAERGARAAYMHPAHGAGYVDVEETKGPWDTWRELACSGKTKLSYNEQNAEDDVPEAVPTEGNLGAQYHLLRFFDALQNDGVVFRRTNQQMMRMMADALSLACRDQDKARDAQLLMMCIDKITLALDQTKES
jgi:hypothetical protein